MDGTIKGNDDDRYVVWRDEDYRWVVKKEDAKRASGLFTTKDAAIVRAREIIKNTGGFVRVQGTDGKWESVA